MKKRSLLVICLTLLFMSTTFLSVVHAETGEVEALFYDSGNYLLEEIGVGLTLPDEGVFSSVTRRSIQSAMDAGYDFQELMDNMLDQDAYAILTSDFEGGEYTCVICGKSVLESNYVYMSEEVQDLLRDNISNRLEEQGAQDVIIDEYYNQEFIFITATYNTITDDVYPSKLYITLFNGYQIWLQFDSHTPGPLPFDVENAIEGVVDSIHAEAGKNTNMVISQRIIDKLKKRLDEEGVDCEIDEETGELVLQSGVLFGVNESSLSEEGKELLEKLFPIYIDVLLDDEFEGIVENVVFEGHTDTSGSYEYNMQLSEKRAETVKDFCLATLDPDLKSIVEPITLTQGYSYDKPIYTENGDVDMDASRRVVIKFTVTGEAYSSEWIHTTEH